MQDAQRGALLGFINCGEYLMNYSFTSQSPSMYNITMRESRLIIDGTVPLFERLVKTGKPVVLYGMGNGADKIIHYLKKYDVELAGVFASDSFVRGHSFHGLPVMTYAQAKETFGNMVVLVAFGTHRENVISNILEIAAEQELYAPDIDVAGRGIFDRDYFEQNEQWLDEVYDLLEDEESREVYRRLINYKLSGSLDTLMGAESDRETAYREILELRGDEVYVDGGAYDGDTVREFINHVKTYRKIYAIEPDSRSCAKLISNTERLSDIECMNLALGNRTEDISFGGEAGRQSSVGGRVMVAQNRIDNIAPDATFIKLDVEGYETASVMGAREVIKRNKPKLQVAAYHKNMDMLMPLTVKEIRGDYKVYIRHFRCVPAWDTYFYFV